MPTNYNTLVSAKGTSFSIKNWANQDKIDVEAVLEDAQSLLFQTLRVREMRASALIPVAAGAFNAALPTGFLDPIDLKNITLDARVDLNTEAEINWRRSWKNNAALEDGTFNRYAIFDEMLQFMGAFDDANDLVMIYYKQPTLLGSGNQTNFLTNRYSHLLRSAILTAAYDYSDDDRYQRQLEKTNALISVTNAESDNSYRGLV